MARDLWRNDRFFQRLSYGLGGGSPREIVHEQPTTTMDPVQTVRMPVRQPVEYPGQRDFDTPQNLTMDHNQRMPYHEGSPDAPQHKKVHPYSDRDPGVPGTELDVEAEVGTNLKELTEERMQAPYSQHKLWPESYSSVNQFEDQSGVHLGQRAPWIAVDLDGTILEAPPPDSPEYGSADMQLPLGPPLSGAVEALSNLAALGWRISIYTARFGDEDLDDATMQQWSDEIADHLESVGVPFSDIWLGRKPRADYFVDDKAITFDGDWDAILEELAVEGGVPRAPEEDEATDREGNWSRQTESGNDFIDPWGSRQDRDIPRPPELEEALYG
jgi:hypothetical protein